MEKEKSIVQKYQPSNRTEGELFKEKFCYNCQWDEEDTIDCEIMVASMYYDIGDSEYPEEWQYGEDVKPCCTNFKRTRCEKCENLVKSIYHNFCSNCGRLLLDE